jgi:hypothetical protein
MASARVGVQRGRQVLQTYPHAVQDVADRLRRGWQPLLVPGDHLDLDEHAFDLGTGDDRGQQIPATVAEPLVDAVLAERDQPTVTEPGQHALGGVSVADRRLQIWLGTARRIYGRRLERYRAVDHAARLDGADPQFMPGGGERAVVVLAHGIGEFGEVVGMPGYGGRQPAFNGRLITCFPAPRIAVSRALLANAQAVDQQVSRWPSAPVR